MWWWGAVQMSEEEDDWRVKLICAFTRSIGDCQMKDKTASTLYNTYTTCAHSRHLCCAQRSRGSQAALTRCFPLTSSPPWGLSSLVPGTAASTHAQPPPATLFSSLLLLSLTAVPRLFCAAGA